MIGEFLRDDRFCENGHCLALGWDKCYFCEQTPNMPSAVRERLTANRRSQPSGKVEKGGTTFGPRPLKPDAMDLQVAELYYNSQRNLGTRPLFLGRLIVALYLLGVATWVAFLAFDR